MAIAFSKIAPGVSDMLSSQTIGVVVAVLCLAASLSSPISAAPVWMKGGAYAVYSIKFQGFLPLSEFSWRVVGLDGNSVTFLESASFPGRAVNMTISYDVLTRRMLNGSGTYSRNASDAPSRYALEWIDPASVSVGAKIPVFRVNDTDYNVTVVGSTSTASRQAWELSLDKWDFSGLSNASAWTPITTGTWPSNYTYPFPAPSGGHETWFQDVKVSILYDKETGILLGGRFADSMNIVAGSLDIRETNALSLKTSLSPFLVLPPLLVPLYRELKLRARRQL